MVGATPAAAAAIVNGCCTLMATNPTPTNRKHNMLSNHFRNLSLRFFDYHSS
jgi:hypothetical protein